MQNEIEPCDILVIAGGDTTVKNVITGLCRRPDFSEKWKNTRIAILPSGKTNNIWSEISGKKEKSTWTRPYGRANRITEAARLIVGILSLYY